MDVFAPRYYKDFKCIADRCKHSCCVGWEIDIDEKALAIYNSAEGKYIDRIRSSIDYADTPHFALSDGERCPHLDSRGLCRIITECGEDFLCDICREHPRFYNRTSHGLEVGVGMACEEAARIILTSDSYAELIPLDVSDGEPLRAEFDSTSERGRIYEILSDRALPYRERLGKIYSEYKLDLTAIPDGEWREVISSLEYLDGRHKELFLSYTVAASVPCEYEPYLERALAYFIFRHTAHAQHAEEFRTYLGFACFMERLLASLISRGACDESGVILLGRIISEEIEYSEDNTENIILTF